jgi:hypothetical protein
MGGAAALGGGLALYRRRQAFKQVLSVELPKTEQLMDDLVTFMIDFMNERANELERFVT